MIRYRTPLPADGPALAALGRDTFVDTFGHLYQSSDLDPFLEKTFSPAAIAAQIDSPQRLYRIAEADGTLMAYCKLSLDTTFPGDFGNRRVLELSQLYVRPAHKGSGIADALMHWTLETARGRGFDDIVLSVYCDNLRAQKFYHRYGFHKYMDWYYMVGNHRDEEFLFRLMLAA